MTITLYGIANCDTVKKARIWLAERGITVTFHDYKKAGADPARIARWVEVLGAEQQGWEALLNRAGTTYRKLPEADRANLDAARAVALMAAHPSCIRRPVVEYSGGLLLGFKPEQWAETLRQ